VDPALDLVKVDHLWQLLEQFFDVFACHKGKLGCCRIKEHIVDTQGFPSCRITSSRLSLWEEVEVKRQINVLMVLRKMKPNTSEYACKVTLLVKKDGSHKFCEVYMPLNQIFGGMHFLCLRLKMF